MNPLQDDERLDDFLAERLGRRRPRLDFRKWQQRYPDALGILKSAACQPAPASRSRPFPLRIGVSIMKNRYARFGVPAAVLLGVVGVFSWLRGGDNGATVAFADVAEKIAKVRSATYTISSYTKDKTLKEESKVMFLAPSRYREEMADGCIGILDFQLRKAVSLDPKRKLALVVELEEPSLRKMAADWLYPFDTVRKQVLRAKSNPDDGVKPLGRRKIDGRTAVGFQVRVPGLQILPFPPFDGDSGSSVVAMWVDPQTALPVRVETLGPRSSFHSIGHDFRFNVELDESLFSVKPPPGYMIRSVETDP